MNSNAVETKRIIERDTWEEGLPRLGGHGTVLTWDRIGEFDRLIINGESLCSGNDVRMGGWWVTYFLLCKILGPPDNRMGDGVFAENEQEVKRSDS